MGLAVWVGKKRYEIGAASFLKSLFSTIYVRLEKEQWGDRYPVFMNDFYAGQLSPVDAGRAFEEMNEIAMEFKDLKAVDLVWDFENREAKAPWIGDDDYDPEVPAQEYLLTSDGKNIFDVLRDAFKESVDTKREVTIT